MRTYILIVLVFACAVTAVSQQISNDTRAQTIAASFNKQKHQVKEKYGVRSEKYKDVRSEPVVKRNIEDYSGRYEVGDLGFVINIQFGSNGRVHATGYDSGPHSRTFKLENARIEGALLTASRVYQDGTTEKFEGVFMNRTHRDSPTDAGTTLYGLGVILAAPVEINGQTYERMFYQLKP